MNAQPPEPAEQPAKRAWRAPDFEEADISVVTEAAAAPNATFDAGYSYS